MKKLITALLIGSSMCLNALEFPTAAPANPAYTASGSNDSISSSTTIASTTTGLSASKLSGRFTNSGNIWGNDEYGAYINTNSWYAYRFNNNGNISSDNMIGVNLTGDNIYFDNGANGSIYGGVVGMNINPVWTGGGGENVFEIDNKGRIESGGTAINVQSSARTVNITNQPTGYIGGDGIGIYMENNAIANIINYGEIEGVSGPAILFTGLTNTIINNGMIKSRDIQGSNWLFNGVAVLSEGDLTLTGNGIFEGDINYSGSLDGKVTLNNFTGSFDGTEFNNWSLVDVKAGFYNIDSASDLLIRSGAYVDGTAITSSITIENGGHFSPYENDPDSYYDTGDYDKRVFKKSYVNNLTVASGGEITIDIKDTKYSSGDYYRDGPAIDGIHNIDGSYGGYGHSSYRGNGFDSSTEHRINHDKIDIAGILTVEDGAILNIFDYTASNASGLWTNYSINAFSGNYTAEELEKFTVNIYSTYFGFVGWEDGKLNITNLNPTNNKSLFDWLVEHVINPSLPAAGAMQDKWKEEHTGPTDDILQPSSLSMVYSPSPLSFEETPELRELVFGINNMDEYEAAMDGLNKMEYASLATSNINSIDNRISNHFGHLNNDFRDANGVNVWADAYYSDSSLNGIGNHDISGRGTEFAVGFDKQLTDSFKFGFSFNHIDYKTSVNDSGARTNIDSEGYGLNAMAMFQQGNLTHKAILGYAQYDNVDKDVAKFDSSEMFAAYRAEYVIKTAVVDVTPIIGLRFASVSYDKMAQDAENGLNAYTQNSLETELGVIVSKQFKRFNVNVSTSWMHELMDRSNTSKAYTSYGSFDQSGIERDADALRFGIGASYDFNEKLSLSVEAAKEFSTNSDTNSLSAKLSLSF